MNFRIFHDTFLWESPRNSPILLEPHDFLGASEHPTTDVYQRT